jgi:hypothetical protein
MLNILLLIAFIFGCDNQVGHRGVSSDISESKKRGVFLAECKGITNPVKINDSLQITINEAWLEKQWAHSSKEEETLLYNEELYQLCVIIPFMVVPYKIRQNDTLMRFIYLIKIHTHSLNIYLSGKFKTKDYENKLSINN